MSEGNESDSGDSDNDIVQLNKKKISDLRILRGTVTMQETKMRNYIESPGRVFSLTELETRLGLLEGYLVRFNDIQGQLECEDPEEHNSDKRQTFEETYIALKGKILALIDQKRPRMSLPSLNNTSAFPSSQVRNASLPKLQIKKFTGNPIDWPDFYATFRTLVQENDSFSNVERLAYLRNSLEEGPAQIINNIGLDENGFENALSLLKTRYENKRLIFQGHIQALFNLKSAEKNSAVHLRQIADSVKSHLRALDNIATKEQIADGLLLQILHDKVDTVILTKWEEEASLRVLPSWGEFIEFLDKRCQTLENTQHVQRNKFESTKSNLPKAKSSNLRRISLTAAQVDSTCILCHGRGHEISNCSSFLKLNPVERFAEVKRLKLCINCLRANHAVKNCKSRRCRYCNFKHNTLLHRHSEINQPNVLLSDPVNESSSITSSPTALINATAMTSELERTSIADVSDTDIDVVLATALIEVRDKAGQFIPYRALLDSGSSLHFVSERMVQQLRLERSKVNIGIIGIGTTSTAVKHKVQIVIKSRVNGYQSSFEALVLPKIASDQPWRSFNVKHWEIPDNLPLADPEFNTSRPVDVLIGASLFFELLSIGQIRFGKGLPVLQKTLLGWVVSGGGKTSVGSCLVAANASEKDDDHIEEVVQRFWELEACKDAVSPLSYVDRECEEHFIRNVKRDITGRFSVKLPFRENPNLLGDSLEIAKKRFFNLEQKLLKDVDLRSQYSEFLTNYVESGHMEKISFATLPRENYFLPHHCVLKPESSSTKLRVVFDASCKTTSGHSLNDVLMVGPVIQDDLFTVLIRFRSHRVALTADISKMYRQVCVEPPDTNWQCIIWRDSPKKALEVYRLTTVTYGTSPASFLSTRCLLQLAQDEESKYPNGAKTLRRDFYVDDMLTGANTLAEAMTIKTETEQLLSRGCFPLTKWCSNSKEILSSIDDACLEKYLNISGEHAIKTLGMIWQPQQDIFRFVNQGTSNLSRITKRTVLSAISRLFDPLGLINPIIVRAKIFLQRLWSLKIAWDETLPQVLHSEWTSFHSQLELINIFKIPRYVMSTSSNVEIHSFADASVSAYGAAVYVRCVKDGDITCNLLTSKSRVAPLKTISIPRLELCAALLAAELTARVCKILVSLIKEVVYWSDSLIVLTWLSSSPSRWSVFVSNRVSKIQELTEGSHWRHISSEDNPADIVSRGATPNELVNSKLWFNGPSFLCMPSHRWPEAAFEINASIPEERKTTVACVATESNDLIESSKFANSYTKLINSFAYIFRFYDNTKIKCNEFDKRAIGPISVYEFERALMAVIRLEQKKHFFEDFRLIKSNKPVKSSSPLRSLNPFIDENNLLRVGGRLMQSNLEHDAKHPILLPKSKFTNTLINYYHYRSLHAGVQSLLAIVRTRFWPIAGKGMAKQVVHGCIRCLRARPKLMEQLMGQLPAARVKPSPVFYNTGVDYCGPFYIKSPVRNRPSTKAYLCIFICLAVKAVHLEVVSSLTTESFLSALTKFIARRPHVAVIHSDNATNFIGGCRELKELKELFGSQDHRKLVQEMCKADGIEWKFIPPRSPHFGGLWEAAVKQAKHHIRRILGLESYSFDELQRISCKVESILNSRPLTPLSSDPNDLHVLTPGHFLTGGQMTSIPEPRLADTDIKLLSRWQHIQAMMQCFWERWRKEYLQSHQQRVKWKGVQDSLRVGSMVILKDDNMPSLKWPLGRVEVVHGGVDGYVRVATIRTIAGLVKRPITKLCPLALEDPDKADELEAGPSKVAGLC